MAAALLRRHLLGERLTFSARTATIRIEACNRVHNAGCPKEAIKALRKHAFPEIKLGSFDACVIPGGTSTTITG
jgi:hypothetical protein